MKPTLELPSGTLRPARRTDIPFVFWLLTDAQVRRYLCDDVLMTEEDVSAILADSARYDADGLGLWIIVSGLGEVAGVVGLAPVTGQLETWPETKGGVEPIIALSPMHWRKGLAKSALCAVMGYARDTLHLPGLVAAVDLPNEASHHLLTSCGFERCGQKQGEKGRLTLYNVPFDKAQTAAESA